MSRKIAYVTDPVGIEEIDQVIHGCFFDPEQINFDGATSILNINFARETLAQSKLLKDRWLVKEWQVPIKQCVLRIHKVIDYRIEDHEQVGRYDLLGLKFDSAKGLLVIKTGIPVGIEVTVQAFEVEVEETDRIIEQKIINSMFDVRNI
jgi:hypothetical protein